MSVFVVFIFQVSCELLGFRSKNKNIKINTVFLDVFDSGRDKASCNVATVPRARACGWQRKVFFTWKWLIACTSDLHQGL